MLGLLPKLKKRVFIAGGGPAGMEAARVAAFKGHRVVLIEQRDHLGRALLLASMSPKRPGWSELRDYLVREMKRLGVDVRLGTKATSEPAKKEGAEVAIVAIGASQFQPAIPGIRSKNVVLSRDLLEGKARIHGEKVVVMGGGTSGAQIADFLSQRENHRNNKRQCTRRWSWRLRCLPGELPADTVVASTGAKPNDSLAEELRKVVSQVFKVGDAVEPRDVTYAMLEGARAGLF